MTKTIYNKDGSIKEEWIRVDDMRCDKCKHYDDNSPITRYCRKDNKFLKILEDWFCKDFKEKKDEL